MKCNKCSTQNGLNAIGNCSGCGAMISQMSDKLCPQCSTKKKACQSCGCALTLANCDQLDDFGSGLAITAAPAPIDKGTVNWDDSHTEQGF